MYIKIVKEAKNKVVELSLRGRGFTSRFMTVFSTLCDGENKIRNFSTDDDSMNLIKILGEFGVKITQEDEANTLSIVGKGGVSNLSQAKGVIDVGSSVENMVFLAILLANQDFKTFITGEKKLLGINLSFLQEYLRNVNIVFNYENRLPMVLFGKPGHCNKTSFMTSEPLEKSFLLLLSLFNRYNAISITDSDIKEEFGESILKYYGLEIGERYFQSTNFLTRESRKCKEITIAKNNPLHIQSKTFEVPVDIKEAFYAIFFFLFSNAEELLLKGVAVNEYNDSILKVLVDNGVNVQFRNQKILNGIRVSDIVVKQSKLKPVSISKLRLREIASYYTFIVLLNIMKNNSFTIMGIDFIKKIDVESYRFLREFCTSLGCDIETDRGNLEFISSEKDLWTSSSISVNHFDSKTNLFLFFSSILLGKNVKSETNFTMLKEEFPNLSTVMDNLGFETDD
ncbi:MAG: hypothetical protein LBG48_04895 [Rickettsiales bacterium]|jgi:5-enolpyruvylshikimate-3-phosphate synthase|nr:hypothetical protein [Rickettsiales bacterium]